jgi:hypothetical protein
MISPFHMQYYYATQVHTKSVIPVQFSAEQHKILEAELKALYTAITRAKCNIWIVDLSIQLRAPMFEYWVRKDVVTVVDSVADGVSSTKAFGKQVHFNNHYYYCYFSTTATIDCATAAVTTGSC